MKVISEASRDAFKKAIPVTRPAVMPHIFELLLFSSHISTNEKVTEVSGRGVGMNVVKKFIDSVGGVLEVEVLEKGTRFNIKLPFSLAIVSALLVKVGESNFAIPLSSIEHTVFVNDSDVKSALDKEVAVIEGGDVPLIRLKNIFGITSEEEHRGKSTVVLIRSKNDLVGLVVDRLVKEQEIIVKPLSSALKRSKGFSGVTILGNGQTVPIIDTVGLIENLSSFN